MAGESRLVAASARPYLFVLVAAVVTAKVGQYLWQYVWPDLPAIKGQSPGIWIAFVGTGIAAVLWLLYRGQRTTNRWALTFLAMLALTWVVQGVLTRIHADSVPYTVLLLPPILLALWLRTPPATDLRASVVFLGWLLGGVLVVTRALEMLGIIPMVDVGDWLIGYETENYWLPLAGWLGPEGRWPGPMGHNAQTGNVGALILVLAIGLRGKARWLLAASGVLTLLLTSSRTSYLAAVAGVVVLLVLDDNALTRRVRRSYLVIGLGALGVLAAAIVITQNPNLTGRTTYWTLALDAWRESPLIGVGANELATSELETLGSNAHNIVIDALMKYGILGVIPVIAVIVVTLTITIGASRRYLVLPLALVVTYLVIGLAEADQGFLSPSIMWLWLILPTLWAAQTGSSNSEILFKRRVDQRSDDREGH